jgi:signal transduction histidine kinase
VRLRLKLLLALLALAVAFACFAVVVLGPGAESAFRERSTALIERSRDELVALAESGVADTQGVLIDLVRNGADARIRDLHDVPLELFGGDVERVREAIAAQERERSDRVLANLRVLAHEMDRRARARIEAHLAELTAEQMDTSAAFGAVVRESALLVAAGTFTVLMLALGFGLDRLVVAPLRKLRGATRRVAQGDLDVAIAAHSADEVGELAGDFTGMVEQLRASRRSLEQWNQTLAAEVARKTQHLEDALARLQQTQSQLVQSEKMAALGTLASGIAHEFNNLICGMRGCVVDAMADDDAERRGETLAVVLRAADRAGDVTGKLLRFARPRVDGPGRVELAALVGEVLDLVEPEAGRLGIDVQRRLAAGVAAMVDSGGIHQVILNLLTNALQAMPDGGTLAVDVLAQNGASVVRVADTGVGIPEPEIDHVFDPFHTSKDREVDPRRRGSGLGLSVSYGIVRAHGGTIRVESRPGAGSVFAIILPAGAARDGG